MQEEQTTCEYCSWQEAFMYNDRVKMSLKGDRFPGIEVSIVDGELYIFAVADTYEPNATDASVKINYCPMCGRKLGEPDQNDRAMAREE